MNTGLCDAYNLAWKLSSVIHRTSPSSILDSYDSERSHAASVVVSTTDKSTKMMTLEYTIQCNHSNGHEGTHWLNK